MTAVDVLRVFLLGTLSGLVVSSQQASSASSLPDGLSICEYEFGQEPVEGSNVPFCVNGGYCKASWIKDEQQPCECLTGYKGPHCEFKENEVPTTCQLGCEHGGICHLGASTWQHFYRGFTTAYGQSWTNPLDLQHCTCPDGYTGSLCEIKGVKCGSDYCHNKGKCIKTEASAAASNGPGDAVVVIVENHCDCTGTSYAGEFCEHAATTFCTQLADHNGHQFCANGGTCRGESHMGCDCPTGFVGPVCEFPDRGQAPVECNLQCHNHGICRKGAKDVSMLDKYGLESTMTSSYSSDFEHCVCPAGYVGLQCEFQLDLCPGGQHACLNGGECMSVVDRSSMSYACNCVNAETSTARFAGEYCEMESTQFCTLDKQKSRTGPGVNSFCTNGGKCRAFVAYEEPHPGCDCSDLFEGGNCQYVRTKVKLDYTILFVTSMIAVVSFGAMVALVVVRRVQRSKKPRYYHRTGVITRSMMSKDDASGMATIDLIAQSLGTNHAVRRSEYRRERAVALMKIADSSRRDRSSMIRGKKPKWTQRRQMTQLDNVDLDDDAIQHSTMPRTSTSIASMREEEDEEEEEEEVDYTEYSIEDERRKYWPNDSHNDASNPIQVFDDVSVDSSSFRDSLSDEGVGNLVV